MFLTVLAVAQEIARGKIATVHPDFRCGSAAVPDGIRWSAPQSLLTAPKRPFNRGKPTVDQLQLYSVEIDGQSHATSDEMHSQGNGQITLERTSS